MMNETDPIVAKENDEFLAASKLRRILSGVGAGLLVLSLGLYLFLLRPMQADYTEMSSVLSSKEESASKLRAEIAAYQNAEKSMDIGTEIQKKTLLNFIPVGVNQDAVIEDLIKIGKANGIVLHSVSFGLADKVYEGVGALKISASFEGNYADLIHFLKGVEENSRLLKVTSINVQVNYIEDLDLKHVTFSLTMDAYYQQ